METLLYDEVSCIDAPICFRGTLQANTQRSSVLSRLVGSLGFNRLQLILPIIAVLLTAALAVPMSAHAGTPTYIGEYIYHAGASGGGGANYLSSEDAAISAVIADIKAKNPTTFCSIWLGPMRQDWTTTVYDPTPVEGVEVGATRKYTLYYQHVCNSPNPPVYTGYVEVYRRRVVCASNQEYLDNKCVGVTPKVQHGQKGANAGPSCPSCGQPINPSTGNMWHVEVDYAAVQALNPLAVRRTYNSIPFSRDFSTMRSFGLGWAHQYDAFLKPGVVLANFESRQCYYRNDTYEVFCKWPDFTQSAIPSGVSIFRGDGKSYVFQRNGNEWLGQADTNDRLLPVFDDAFSTVLAWEYRSAKDDTTERYDANGLLLSIARRSGDIQRLTYSTGQSNDTSVSRFPAAAPVCSQIQEGALVPANRLLCVTDNWGRQLHFKYDASGRISQMIDPAGQSTTYEYDGPTGGCLPEAPSSKACSANNLTKVRYPDGKSRTYIYNESSRINGGAACDRVVPSGNGYGHLLNSMTGLIDENGVRHITWRYSCSGLATSSELANGIEKVALSYILYSDGRSNTTVTHTVGDPASPQTTVRQYAAASILGVIKNQSISQPCVECGSIASRTYDANGNVASATDFNGAVTKYTYDLNRNLETSRTEAFGTTVARTITTAWHAGFRLPVQVAEPKRLTTYTYDTGGNLLTRVEQATSDLTGASGLAALLVGLPRTWSYTYNAAGQTTTVTGPRTDLVDLTTYAYDASGNLETVTNAAGHVTTLSNHDAHGRVGRIVNPNGLITDLRYTPRGWLASRTVFDGTVSETTTYEYDGSGQVTKVTAPDGSWTSYAYDAAHRLTGITDNQGNSIAYTLDLTGNRIREQVTDPGGALRRNVSRIFDTANRMQQQTGGDL